MYKKICIKIGTNVLTDDDQTLNKERISHLVDQISVLKKQGKEIILVSSGAVAAGKQIFKPEPCQNDTVSRRQLWASLGQVQLMNAYSEIFNKYGLLCSQVLVTKNDFKDRDHYLNMKNCISVLLNNNIIPVINENDVVSITELMFTDNDELAGLIASMTNSEALIILSNIDGIYDGNPDDSNSKVITEIDKNFEFNNEYISSKKSNFGRGGMLTKYHIAKKVASAGITVYITNGLKDYTLVNLLKNESSVIHTKFKPGRKKSNIKKWIAHSEGFEKGKVFINKGAKEAFLSNKARSLLLIGVTKIEGDFKSGDIVKIFDEDNNSIGLGRVKYNAEEARKNMGCDNCKPLIHYDYLYLSI